MLDQRAIRLSSALGDRLRFRRMDGEETLSRPFRFELDLASDDPAIGLADLLGTPMAVEIDLLGGGKRFFHGLVSRFAFAGYQDEEARYRATLRPWLWFLTRTADCRIFQEMTAPDIARAIFAKHSDRSVHVEDRLERTFATRVYCVQYRESDLDFVDRLYQDEGITYFFVHEADKHTLVLADSPAAHGTCPSYEEVPYYPLSAKARRERDHVYAWDAGAEVRSGRFAHTSFDFEKPRADLMARRDQPLAQPAWAEGEVYDYSGRYTEPDLGERSAELRLEADQAEHRLLAGEATAAGLATGHRFKLTGFPRAEENAEYLLRDVRHELWDPAYRSGAVGGEDVEVYRCRFTAMPADVPYRPALTTPKPLIRGPQTAMVTGPAGEEIWTDKYGRVKVQFPWDREGKRDEKSSCWVRVSQLWAGPAFGGIHVPRIGQEVIVEHLEGDPDRPIITGRVYNAQAMPPYGLPANATQSGIKSNSSKGGGGSNELRFEDKKGQEQVYLHAQKDESIVVENDKTESVGHDETATVGNNRTRKVGVDEFVTVGSNQTIAIGTNQTEAVGANRTDTVALAEVRTVGGVQQQTVGAARNISVGGAQAHEVGVSDTWAIGVNRSVSVGKDDALAVASNRSVKIDGDDSLRIDGKRGVEINGDSTTRVGGDEVTEVTGGSQVKIGKVFTLSADDQISLVTGDASITMKKNGDIALKGKNISIDASGKITIKASGQITQSGSKILQN